MNNDDKLMLIDLYYELMDVVLFDNNDMNLYDDYGNIQRVHWNKFDMNDNHVYVYNNVHQH
jgi:hypothetical protein